MAKKYLTDAAGAPAAIGPYSQAVVMGNLAFLSGQIALDPQSGEIVSDDVGQQAEQVMKNLAAVLASLDLGFEHVAKTTIFLTDMADFQTVNAVYENALGDNKPARATVEVSGLPRGVRVEMDMTAVIGS